MKRYKGVLLATIICIGATIVFWLIGREFVLVAGTSLITSGMILSLYWLETIFGKRDHSEKDPREYRKIHFPVLLEGFALGGINYLTLKLLFHRISDLLTAISILLPAFVGGYIIRLVYLITPEEKRHEILTPWSEFLIVFFANVEVWGIIAGFKIVELTAL